MSIITLKNTGFLTKSKQLFIEQVLELAEKNGATLDFNGKSGAWSTKNGCSFGLSFGSDLDFDTGLFQLCKCYVLTLNIKWEILND
jgi:hypothetical protein